MSDLQPILFNDSRDRIGAPAGASSGRRQLGEFEHLVQFYEHDGFLERSAATYLDEGLRAEGAAVLIASPGHRSGIEERLRAAGFELEALQRSGRYFSLDPAETLDRLMVGGLPDRDRVIDILGGLIARASRQGRRRLRIFGEMVALLVAQGNAAAAVRLEELWDELSKSHVFSLLCGYPLGHLGGEPAEIPFAQICGQHSQVIPAESYVDLEPHERMQAIVRLQHKAARLEAEIDERRRVEKALREERTRLTMAARMARLGVFELDAATMILTGSAECMAHHGIAPGEPFSYQALFRRIHPEDRPRVREALQAAITSRGGYAVEYRVPGPAGRMRWISAMADVLENGCKRLLGVTMDVTEGKHAMQLLEQTVAERTSQLQESIAELDRKTQTLEESEAQFRSLVDNIPGVVFRTDPAPPYTLRFLNEAVAEVTGLPAEHYLSGRCPFASLLHPDEAAEALAEMERSVKQRRAFQFETRALHTDGSQRWLLTRGRVVLNPQGQPRSIKGASFDITLQKRAEELESARVAAEAANHAKSEFLTTLSHELRTPLNGILGMGNLLLDTPLDREQTDYVRTVCFCADILVDTISDVLDISKIEAGKLELDRETFAPRQLFEEVLRVTEGYAQGKELDLILSWDERIGSHLVGDGGRLRQILMNLVSNAVKFTDRGQIQVRAEAISGGLRVEVEDTGIGIADEDKIRLFNAFEQLDNSSSRKYSGTGLGLAIARRLAELMGGSIGVRSTPGVGSVFWFTVALEPAEELPEPSGSLPVAGLDRSRLRLLVAEDNSINRRVTVLQLKKLGYRVESVNDGEEAVQAWRDRGHDLILMDCQMPGVDGYEATRRIRRQVERHQPIIIALTAHAHDYERRRTVKAGMDDYLSKPVNGHRLQQVLDHWAAQISTAAAQ